MFSFILTLSSALVISVIGAYFSIIGLSTIFPGSKSAVIIMGCALEVAKIVTVLWLHRNWSSAKFSLKAYFSFAVLVLMGITSLGIFGFLSKAHVEHKNAAVAEITQIENLESRIEKERGFIIQYENYIKSLEENSDDSDDKSSKEIDREEKRLQSIAEKLKQDIELETKRIDQLSERKKALDEELAILEASSGGLFSNKKKQIEELNLKQKEEREYIKNKTMEYNSNIESFRENYNQEYAKIISFIENFRKNDSDKFDQSQQKIEDYSLKIKKSMESIQDMEVEKSKYGEKIRNLEAEIGPLKYVVGMIEDFGGKELTSDQAVRLIILIIMIVFDPLAILLVVAAQTTFYTIKKNVKQKKEEPQLEKKTTTLKPKVIEPELEPEIEETEQESIIEDLVKKSTKPLETEESQDKPERELITESPLKKLGNGDPQKNKGVKWDTKSKNET